MRTSLGFQGRAQRAARAGLCTCGGAATRTVSRHGTSTVRAYRTPFGPLACFPAAGPAALRPCRATAVPGWHQSRGDRRDEHSAVRPAPGARRREEGPSLRYLILKPCQSAVKPVCDRRQQRTAELPGTCTRKVGLDRALDKDSGGTSRKDGQDRAPPSDVIREPPHMHDASESMQLLLRYRVRRIACE